MSNLRRAIQLVLLALVACVAGCARAPMIVTQQMHDSTVEVEVGQAVDVELAENPSTGWLWKLQTPINGILDPKGVSFTPGQGAAGRVGVGGLRVFHYRSTAAGEARLVYALVPPGSGGKPSDQTFTVSVRVGR